MLLTRSAVAEMGNASTWEAASKFHNSARCTKRKKHYVCLLYASLCAPLLLPWLGEVEGISLAIA